MKNSTSLFHKIGLILAFAGLFIVFASLNVLAASARPAIDETASLTFQASGAATAPAQGSSPHASGDCLACHQDEGMKGVLLNGEVVDLHIVPVEHKGSFHNQKGIGCKFCHQDQAEYPHKGTPAQACAICHWQISGGAPQQGQEKLFELPYEDARALALDINNACQQCHDKKFAEVKESAHTRIMNEGNRFAPVCVDCHTGHNITTVDRQTISQVCSRCHLAEYTTYKGSVHGAALEKESNPDVPTCEDCHGAHNVKGPSESDFRENAATEMCGKCHSSKLVMEKYGISTDVLSTYMDDVHGHTDVLGRLDNSSITKATCYDCHGTHNILSPKNPYSKVYPDNLQKTCQECHKDASITFPEAWLSHKTPTLSVTPGLYLSNVLSLGAVVVTVAGIAIFIILDIRRRMAGRVIIRIKREE
jgi:hypothetical protein